MIQTRMMGSILLSQMKRKMTTEAHVTYSLTGESPSNEVMQQKKSRLSAQHLRPDMQILLR